MLTVKVKATGHGLGFNKYPVEFEFTMNGLKEDWDDEDQFNEEVSAKARRKAKEKTACDSVTLEEINVME